MAFDKKVASDGEDFEGDLKNEANRKNTVVEQDPSTKDFYDNYDPYKANSVDRDEYQAYLGKLNPSEKKMLQSKKHFYELNFQLVGGLVMPIILEFTFEDGSTEKQYIPAEIWRMNNKTASKVFWFDKEVRSINLDPNLETADVDRSNNYWPPRLIPSRFELFNKKTKEKEKELKKKENVMQRANRAK